LPAGLRFEEWMVAVVGGPKIVARFDAPSARVGKESVTEALNQVALRVIFGVVGLVRWNRKMCPLEFTAAAEASPTVAPLGDLKKLGTTR